MASVSRPGTFPRAFLWSWALLLGASAALQAKPVSFTGTGGARIVGNFFPPAKPERLTVVLLHGVGSSKEEWDAFSLACRAEGLGLFAYDARGHGESTGAASGKKIDYRTFYSRGPDSEWGKMVGDLELAVQFLRKSRKIDPSLIAIGGASIGANIALRYAVNHPAIPCFFLLSPGVDYQGLTAGDAIQHYGNRRLLLAVSPGDLYAWRSAELLKTLVQPATSLTFLQQPPNSGHGVQMFRRTDPEKPSELESRILEWLSDQP